MYEQFMRRGIPVTLVRSTDETLSPTQRVNRILEAYGNNSNVVVISNHINAASPAYQGAEGAEVIYALRNNDTLARNILQALENAGQKVRTYYQRRLPSNTSRDYYFIHRDTGVTEPVIVEYGFIDNPTDLARIQNNYREYVDAVVNAVIATKQGQTIEPDLPANIYIVKSGDSLWSIANRYNTTVSELRLLNNLTSNNLTIGQRLQVPVDSASNTGNTYTVKSGDSLWSIANRYNTTPSELRRLNNLTSDTLRIGQVLQIPTSSNTGTNTGNTYTVKSGDSLWSIANRYNTTVSAIKSANNLTNDTLTIGQVLQIPVGSDAVTGNTYTVKSGDSLWSIANRYNTSVTELQSLNNLTSNTLSIGQVLQIPTNTNIGIGTTYTVKSGDSLWSIANRYNTTVSAIKALNNLTSNTISIGQTLQIP